MGYRSMQAAVADLERAGELIRIREEVDPYLEMASIHRRVFERSGPALFFERVKGSPFPAVSNLFGTLDRARFLFRDTLRSVQSLAGLKYEPMEALKRPFHYAPALRGALSALPQRIRRDPPVAFGRTRIGDLPQIVCWPRDGGPFILLPQVYSEDVERPGPMGANLGMYRAQLGGNAYLQDREIGLHYQLHRGIGIHQSKAKAAGEALRVSIFVGGPPAHTFAAVMPLPESFPELVFAGVLGGRRFRYSYDDEGFCLSADADFVITGTVDPELLKPEGPFGDHLGYYSLTHDFPVLRVHRVYHRRGAIWPFTVVGRPPQEDTAFGALVHELSGDAIPQEIPGVHAVHAVDAAGVHPLCLAIGSERYTPYAPERRPEEILTLANHILGTNQLSLAKYLLIVAREDDRTLDVEDVSAFLRHLLERIDLERDLHFQTRTTIDTLDYSGTGLNQGSKVVMAAAGPRRRELWSEIPRELRLPDDLGRVRIVLPGIAALELSPFTSHAEVGAEIERLEQQLAPLDLRGLPLLVLCDDADFLARSLENFVWVTFTRSNPSHDLHGVGSFIEHKHWGCRGSLIIDARRKPHHAPPLEEDPAVERRVDRLGARGGSLHGII